MIDTILRVRERVVALYGEDAYQEAVARCLKAPPRDTTHLDRWLSVVARNYHTYQYQNRETEPLTGQEAYDPRDQLDAHFQFLDACRQLKEMELPPRLLELARLDRPLTGKERKQKHRLIQKVRKRNGVSR